MSRLARRIGVVLVAVIMLSWLGLTSALDSKLQQLYYSVRGARTTNTGVLMVGIDRDTVRTWGAPPWKADRWDPLFHALLSGNPKLITVLEPRDRLFAGTASSSARVIQARANGSLILPPASHSLGQPAVVFDGSAVDAVSLRMPVGVPTAIHQVLDKLGVDTKRRSSLPVNYLGTRAALPTLPAHRIAANEIPPSTFKDRVIVVGLVGEGVAPLVPTPVGPMTASEVHVHALLALTDGQVWRAVPGWMLWALVLLLAMLSILALPRLSGRRTLWLVGGLLATCLVADYILFSRGIALMGATLPGTAVLIAAMVSWVTEQSHAHTELAALVQWTKDHLTSGRNELPKLDGSDRSIERFVESTRLLLDFDGSVFAELPRGQWHLRLRVFNRLSPDDVVELRRDVRREPFKAAYVSHRPEWASRTFVQGQPPPESLLVPLVEFGRVLGVWVLTFDGRDRVGTRELEVIDALADELTRALSGARLMGDAGGPVKTTTSGALATEVAEVYDSVFAFAASQTHLNQTLNLLPVGVLVAAFSGTLQFVNVAMRQFLGAAGIHDPGSITLIELLSALLSQSEDQVSNTLRGLLGKVGFVRMSVVLSSPSSPPARYELVITRVSADAGIGTDRRGHARGPSQFVITASAQHENVLERADWKSDQAEARPQMRVLPAFALVDVSQMLRTLIADVAGTASVTLEAPEALPLVHTSGSGLSQGIASLLTLHPRSHIRVEEHTNAVEIDLEIPEMMLTASDVAALNSNQTRSISSASPAQDIAEASVLLQQAQAEVLVASSLENGTTIGVLVRTNAD